MIKPKKLTPQDLVRVPVILTPEDLQQEKYRQKLLKMHRAWQKLQLKLEYLPKDNRVLAKLLSQEEQALYINPKYSICPNIRTLVYEEIDDPLTPEAAFWEWLDDRQETLMCRGHYVTARQLREFKRCNTPIIFVNEYWYDLDYKELNKDISKNSGPRPLSGGIFSPR